MYFNNDMLMKKAIPYLFLIFVLTLNWNCKKTGPAEAIVTILDSLGQPVAGAKVILRQDSVQNTTTGVRADVYQEHVTSSNGEAVFSFELEAVLNIEVIKDSIHKADEYIRLEQSKTVRKTVVID